MALEAFQEITEDLFLKGEVQDWCCCEKLPENLGICVFFSGLGSHENGFITSKPPFGMRCFLPYTKPPNKQIYVYLGAGGSLGRFLFP